MALTPAHLGRSTPNALHSEWHHTDQPVGTAACSLNTRVKNVVRHALLRLGLPTDGASVVSAQLVTGLDAGGLRFEYCRVLGAISPPPIAAKTGTPPINFQLNLPTNWNGKAVHMGGGGYNGTIVSGTAPVLHILGVPPLQQGYATFGSDSGHVGLFTNAEFATNEGALRNFAYEHIKKTHDAAIALIEAKYGRAPSKSYFAGASTGGREGLTAIQRYPNDYDGVVINAPAIYFSSPLPNLTHYSHPFSRSATQTMVPLTESWAMSKVAEERSSQSSMPFDARRERIIRTA
jgi:hypothetical protein